MYMERPSQSWNLCLAPAKKNGRFKLEELEMREGIGGGLPLSRVWWRDRDWSGLTRSDGLRGQTPIIGYSICPLTTGAGGVMKVNKDGLSRDPMFNYEVTE